MAKYDAYGTKLYKGTTTGTAYAQIVSLSGPGMSLDMIDVTSHDSTAAWEEVVGGILRSGEMTMEIVYDPANATHADLVDDIEARTAIVFTIEFSDAATTEWTFSGFVSGFETDMAHDGALTATVTIKPTGDLTLV
jgi:predicted secreted protein